MRSVSETEFFEAQNAGRRFTEVLELDQRGLCYDYLESRRSGVTSVSALVVTTPACQPVQVLLI